MIRRPEPPVYRFAPTPNGLLHLGHAYSALLNARAARAGGRLLLRIEDIDRARSKREFEEAMIADLGWLGLFFEAPALRQSARGAIYAQAYRALAARGLLYPCWCAKRDIPHAGGGRDPDGAPLYPGTCRALSPREREARASVDPAPTLRLDMARALALAPDALAWREYGEGERERLEPADPAIWGDVALKRRGAPATYHLAVVIDDAAQGVSDVIRGRDLFAATALHRLLQELLALAAPRYRHHRLVLDAGGEKMSKSASSTSLAALRAQGVSPAQIGAALGFGGVPGRLAVRLS